MSDPRTDPHTPPAPGPAGEPPPSRVGAPWRPDAPVNPPPTPGAPAEVAPAPARPRRLKTVIEWIAVAIGALAVAFLIRAFLLQAFWIPSESMEPTLHRDDRILVNKLSYRFGDVGRGDLVVFSKPPAETATEVQDLIKRVVAIEHETVEHRDGQVVVDGQALEEPYLLPDQPTGAQIGWVPGCANPSTERDRCTIPEGHVWVMGDNRARSQDSRFFGPIPESSIIGRAFVKVWPLSDLELL